MIFYPQIREGIMKQKFLDYAIDTIHTNNPTIDDTRLAELRYGLEGMYLSITKLIVIFTLAILFGIIKEMLVMLVIFNILRTTGFGLHATKSWICLVSSSIIFLGLPLIAKFIVIPTIIRQILAIISIILIYKYAPADTKKRPLIKKKKREIYKFITTLNCILLNIASLFITNNVLNNLIIFGIYAEVIVILPLSYNLFHMSYNNYKTYQAIYG